MFEAGRGGQPIRVTDVATAHASRSSVAHTARSRVVSSASLAASTGHGSRNHLAGGRRANTHASRIVQSNRVAGSHVTAAAMP